MNIIEGNKLIAEFMGEKPEVTSRNNYGDPLIKRFGKWKAMQYHSDFNWLMPVVEKITKLNPKEGKEHYWYSISYCHCRIYANTAFGISWQYATGAGTTIEAVWHACIEFIKWYNNNKTTQP